MLTPSGTLPAGILVLPPPGYSKELGCQAPVSPVTLQPMIEPLIQRSPAPMLFGRTVSSSKDELRIVIELAEAGPAKRAMPARSAGRTSCEMFMLVTPIERCLWRRPTQSACQLVAL